MIAVPHARVGYLARSCASAFAADALFMAKSLCNGVAEAAIGSDVLTKQSF